MLCCCGGDEGRVSGGDSDIVSGSGGDGDAQKQNHHNYFHQ